LIPYLNNLFAPVRSITAITQPELNVRYSLVTSKSRPIKDILDALKILSSGCPSISGTIIVRLVVSPCNAATLYVTRSTLLVQPSIIARGVVEDIIGINKKQLSPLLDNINIFGGKDYVTASNIR